MTKPTTNPTVPLKLQGKTFVLAGKAIEWLRQSLEELITGEGGQVISTVTAALDFLIVFLLVTPGMIHRPGSRLASPFPPV